jgi:hypothetical protein
MVIEDDDVDPLEKKESPDSLFPIVDSQSELASESEEGTPSDVTFFSLQKWSTKFSIQ